MKESELRTRTKAFALHMIAVCDEIDTRKGRGVLVNQVIRSATSIGANIHEADYAESPDDFLHKMGIALKECHETEYWMMILAESCPELAEEAIRLQHEAGSIRRMLIATITTLKKSLGKLE